MAEIMDMLKVAGFEKTAQIQSGAEYTVAAVYKGLPFTWKVNKKEVENAMTASYSDRTLDHIKRGTPTGRSVLETIRRSAERIAWRVLAAHVKSGCIAVQYGVADVPDIFAGYLAMNTGETLGNQIKTAAAEGKLSKGSIAGLLE